jgi:hypothetical protein
MLPLTALPGKSLRKQGRTPAGWMEKPSSTFVEKNSVAFADRRDKKLYEDKDIADLIIGVKGEPLNEDKGCDDIVASVQ